MLIIIFPTKQCDIMDKCVFFWEGPGVQITAHARTGSPALARRASAGEPNQNQSDLDTFSCTNV